MNNRKKILMLWGVILSPFIFIFTLVTLASFEFFGPLPTFDQLENPKNNLATEVISADSVVIGKFFIENRTSAKKKMFLKTLFMHFLQLKTLDFANTQVLMLELC